MFSLFYKLKSTGASRRTVGLVLMKSLWHFMYLCAVHREPRFRSDQCKCGLNLPRLFHRPLDKYNVLCPIIHLAESCRTLKIRLDYRLNVWKPIVVAFNRLAWNFQCGSICYGIILNIGHIYPTKLSNFLVHFSKNLTVSNIKFVFRLIFGSSRCLLCRCW
jgi:hypothetical protein